MKERFDDLSAPEPRARRRSRRLSLVSPVEVPRFVGSFIVRGDGSIEHASSESRAWLSVPRFETSMIEFIRELEGSTTIDRDMPRPFAPFATASVVRLVGPCPRYHVRVTPGPEALYPTLAESSVIRRAPR